ncbi:uncharacterized protein LOC124956753 isoform X2 [Vespa velutina]|uniref:uncharacterized protein LOC124956753 isoform X2 n=1 Tax=Vespa velutina TaxID=202808 RepID=UPI001FB1E3D6|nr:uncharacterized protein LOC124956753 isoform X2 [Vespa velutina]
MFYSHELLSMRQKGKFARCWLAATVNDQIFKQMCKSSAVNGINLCELCIEIMNTIQIESNETNRRFSLYLSSQLMYGAVKILLYQTTNLQTQVFQIDKKVLYYKKNKIYEVDNISKNLESCNITCMIQDFNDIQSDNTLPVLCDELNINTKMEAMMRDAACLDFGALTHEQLNFLLPNEIFERMHITNSNLDRELNDTSPVNKNIVSSLEVSDITMHKIETGMSIDNVSIENEVDFGAYTKTTLSDITVQEFIPAENTFLTPQKRQSVKSIHVETPIKKRRLRFEDTAVPNTAEIVTIPEVISVPTADYFVEPLENLESMHVDSQQIKIKSKRKKIFADKNIKFSHKIIRKWISDVNAHTVPLSVINVNISTSEILFQMAPARFTSTRKNKWNSPLVRLFNTHAVVPSIKKKIQVEGGQLLEKSSEFLRLMDRSNKTEELLSDLSSAIGRTAEISKNISSEKSVAISIDELPEVIKFHDVMASTNDELEKVQSPNIARESFIPNASPDSSSLPSYLLTKQELLALLEIIWRNNQFATFTDIISPDHYSKLDASCCFTFLLELYKEKRIILKQATPYDIIWIQKYA